MKVMPVMTRVPTSSAHLADEPLPGRGGSTPGSGHSAAKLVRSESVKMAMNVIPQAAGESPYVSPKELALRWRCSRSSVDRITRQAGLSRVVLGNGVKGMVRYVRKEVEAYEAARRVEMSV